MADTAESSRSGAGTNRVAPLQISAGWVS